MSGSQLMDGKRGSIFWTDPHDLVIVGLDTDDGPEHDLHDKRVRDPLDPLFVESIVAFGVQTPIQVAVKDGRYYVVYGRQRTRGAREAIAILKSRGEDSKILVPCMAAKMGDTKRLAQIAIVENEHRRQDSIAVKAEKAQTLLDRGADVARVALVFAVDTNTVRSWLKFASLSAPVKDAVEAGRITATAASKWADMKKADQVAALELALADSGGKRVSVAKAARAVNPDAPVRPKKADLIALAERDSVAAVGIRIALGLDPMPECKAAAE
jgi:ParB-like chromosome segregation protein Spo0J